MDTDISRWVLEFLLRQPLQDTILSALINILPLPNTSPSFKDSLILRKIESHIANNSISEHTLQLLEYIEELYAQQGTQPPQSLKPAYCAVAVDCTVRFLGTNWEQSDKINYIEAVKRIWKQRVGAMVRAQNIELVSVELLEWRDAVEAALWDDVGFDNVIKRSRSVETVEVVERFVREAKERMGPTFLEVVADALRRDESLKECVSWVTTEDGDVSEKSVQRGVSSSSGGGSVQGSSGNVVDQGDYRQGVASKPSLMARNNTAHTFEWDDSIDDITEGSSIRGMRSTLPTLKRLKVTTRRKAKRWSTLEENTLRSGVQKYGVGNWKLILDTYHETFEDRTPVDLKDKWRNLTSYS